MVVKKSNVIGIALLLVLAISPISTGVAQGANNLVQLDLKRASNDSVNVTLFTSNSYNDNILVRKKSDNKYVILVPKVQSSGYSSPSLNGLKDLVSNVDVKTVNDTSGGYTKVTLITTKPLDIKTNARQSVPVTAEQKEYKTLIAEANAIKNNIAAPKTNQHKVQSKTEITVNKVSSTSEKATKQIDVKKEDLRIQCERETKNLLMKFRSHYLLYANSKKTIEYSFLPAIKSCMAIFKAILRLKDIEVPKSPHKITDKINQICAIDKTLFEKLLCQKEKHCHMTKSEIYTTADKIVSELTKLLEYVNNI